MHDAKSKKPDSKGHSIIRHPVHIRTENRPVVARNCGWVRGGKDDYKGQLREFGGEGAIALTCILNVVVISQLYAFVKIHRTVH